MVLDRAFEFRVLFAIKSDPEFGEAGDKLYADIAGNRIINLILEDIKENPDFWPTDKVLCKTAEIRIQPD